MFTLNVQDYLRTHTLGDLARDHGIFARHSTVNKYKFGLNYGQIEARDADPLSQECRGLVLATPMGFPPVTDDKTVVGDTEIMAFPMRRFFNFGQGAAAPVDMNDPETSFQEKLDGSCIIVYWDRFLLKWCAATRSVPDADLPMDGFGEQTFADLFWKAFDLTGGDKTALYPGWTYVFELCTPDNQVVVRYTDYKVHLLATRWNSDGGESDPTEWAERLHVPLVPRFRFGSVEEMINFVTSRDPTAHEGLVVCDKNFNRVKIKDPAHLALSKIKDSVAKSPRALMEIVLLGKEDDVIPLIQPHIQEKLLALKEAVRLYLIKMEQDYTDLYHQDRKTFALAVQARKGSWMGYMMHRWTGKCDSAHGFIHSQRNMTTGSWNDSFLDTLLENCKKSA